MSIEKITIDHLNSRLTVPAAAEKPKGPPPRYVLIEKTGSRDDHGLLTATLAVQSIAPTLYEAITLNEETKTAMKSLTEHPGVFRCHCETDYNFTNTQTKERRYQAVFEVVYKED